MSSYLVHHGIKGMKWGIRRYQNEDGSLTSAGRNRYGYDKSLMNNKNIFQRHRMKSAQKVAYRLNNNFDDRKHYMSIRQRESYNRAKKYWEARALGEKTPRRNFIKRMEDKYRSKTLTNRAAKSFATNMAATAVGTAAYKASVAMAKKYFDVNLPDIGAMSVPKMIKSSAFATGQTLLTSEIVDRIFGHF